MHQVLAREWRPKNFQQLVGQEHISTALSYALDNNRLHHAYLLTGTRGVGKTTIARILAKSLNCKTNGVSSNPCGKCDNCLEIDQGNFPDLIEIDGASQTKADDTRELLATVPYAPVKGKFKVYLIDEVHMFSNHSANALLKTLEEPPSHVKFILATTDPQKLPITVVSRCLQFHLKNLNEQQITKHLIKILKNKSIPLEHEAVELIAKAGKGSMRDSLSLLDQAIAFGCGTIKTEKVSSLLGAVPSRHLINILVLLANNDVLAIREQLSQIKNYSPDYSALLAQLISQIQRISVLQLNAQLPSETDNPLLQELAKKLPLELIQLWYQIAGDTWQILSVHPNGDEAFEMMLLRMAIMQPLMPNQTISPKNIINEISSPIELSSKDLLAKTKQPNNQTAKENKEIQQIINTTPPETKNQQTKEIDNEIAIDLSNKSDNLQEIDAPFKLEKTINNAQLWGELVNYFDNQNIKRIINNSLPIKLENQQLTLELYEVASVFIKQEHIDQLTDLLQKIFKIQITITIIKKDEVQTPHHQQQSIKQQKLIDAKNKLINNIFIKKFQEDLQADLSEKNIVVND